MPATENTLVIFAQYLKQKVKSADTIRQYLNGVKTLHTLSQLQIKQFDGISLNLTLKGIARLSTYQPKQAQPITLELLVGIRATLDFNKLKTCLHSIT